MERFRLRVRHEPKRGNLWELHMEPERPARANRAAPLRILGTASSPESVRWLAEVAAPMPQHLDPPIDIARFGPKSEPVYFDQNDGMRLALAFSSAHYLVSPRQRRLFKEGLEDLPGEVLLYWFTLCFYGRRTAAGRAALRVLLTHEDPVHEQNRRLRTAASRRAVSSQQGMLDLFVEGGKRK